MFSNYVAAGCVLSIFLVVYEDISHQWRKYFVVLWSMSSRPFCAYCFDVSTYTLTVYGGGFSPRVVCGHRVLPLASVTSDIVITCNHILYLLSCASFFFFCLPYLCWEASIRDLSCSLCACGHHWL